MPEYYNLRDWQGRGSVIITPKPNWRRIHLLNQLFPYRVGDVVEFHVHIDKPKSENPYNPQAIYEYFGNGLPNMGDSAERLDFDFKGHPIRFTGDVVYSIGNLAAGYSDTIFHTYAESRDQALSKVWWFVLGALLTLVCGVTVGIILKLIPIP